MGYFKNQTIEELELNEAQDSSIHSDFKSTKSLSKFQGGTSKPNMKEIQSHGLRLKSFKTFKNAK